MPFGGMGGGDPFASIFGGGGPMGGMGGMPFGGMGGMGGMGGEPPARCPGPGLRRGLGLGAQRRPRAAPGRAARRPTPRPRPPRRHGRHAAPARPQEGGRRGGDAALHAGGAVRGQDQKHAHHAQRDGAQRPHAAGAGGEPPARAARRCRAAALPGCRAAGLLCCRAAKLPRCWAAGLPSCQSAAPTGSAGGVAACWAAGRGRRPRCRSRPGAGPDASTARAARPAGHHGRRQARLEEGHAHHLPREGCAGPACLWRLPLAARPSPPALAPAPGCPPSRCAQGASRPAAQLSPLRPAPAPALAPLCSATAARRRPRAQRHPRRLCVRDRGEGAPALPARREQPPPETGGAARRRGACGSMRCALASCSARAAAPALAPAPDAARPRACA
jgi:hypothetical protein